MRWYPVHTFSLQQDLSALLQLLSRQNLRHRVTEELEGQCLWVTDQQAVESLKQFIASGGVEQLTSIPVHLETTKPDQPPLVIRVLGLWNRYPITLLTLYFALLGALLMVYDHGGHWVALLTFQPLQIQGHQIVYSTLSDGLGQGQWWRLVTPVFLHFGLFHILFNGLWVWEFGRRLEAVFGSARLLGLMLLLAIGSNTCQYFWTGPSLFGGLSGVLYGLLGFLWIYNRSRPNPELTIAPGIVGFMLFWMVLCMTGIVNEFMDGSVANGAHLGGLVAGMLAGYLSAKAAPSS